MIVQEKDVDVHAEQYDSLQTSTVDPDPGNLLNITWISCIYDISYINDLFLHAPCTLHTNLVK